MGGKHGELSPRARWRSFLCAWRGLARLVREEPNAKIELAATVLVVALAVLLDVPLESWRWLVVAIAAVWSAEAANTALEHLCDAVAPEPHPLIGAAKDVAAGGVLIAAVAAALIGALVLGRPLLALLAALASDG